MVPLQLATGSHPASIMLVQQQDFPRHYGVTVKVIDFVTVPTVAVTTPETFAAGFVALFCRRRFRRGTLPASEPGHVQGRQEN